MCTCECDHPLKHGKHTSRKTSRELPRPTIKQFGEPKSEYGLSRVLIRITFQG